MRWIVYLAPLFAAAAATDAAAQSFPQHQRLPAETLDAMRGGFDLPGGIVVTLGVVTSAALDGQEVLRTVFDIQQGAPTIQAFADRGTGLQAIPVQDAENGIQTTIGTLIVRNTAQGARVDLSGRDISVSNLLGSALGTIVANAADNRTVDVATTVNIQVSGVDPTVLGSVLPLINTIATDAATRLAR